MLGWAGQVKYTLLIHKKSGSFFVLGELFTSLDLPLMNLLLLTAVLVVRIDICPTQAIVEPYMLDARRHCLSHHRI